MADERDMSCGDRSTLGQQRTQQIATRGPGDRQNHDLPEDGGPVKRRAAKYKGSLKMGRPADREVVQERLVFDAKRSSRDAHMTAACGLAPSGASKISTSISTYIVLYTQHYHGFFFSTWF